MVKATQLPSSNEIKYATANPLMREIIARFQRRVVKRVSELAPEAILDIGCGEGQIAFALRGTCPQYTGVDVSEEAVTRARQNVPEGAFKVADARTLDLARETFDVAMCLEVLEHLEDPRAVLASLAGVRGKTYVLSVPWEPWFRYGNFLRGKYWRTLGNHPEHVQQFSPRSFRSLLAEYFDLPHVETCFPWIMATVRSRP